MIVKENNTTMFPEVLGPNSLIQQSTVIISNNIKLIITPLLIQV